jgi:hypothetical protein
MYTYQIEYLNESEEKLIQIKWNCSCNDPKTTLMLAQGDCKRMGLDVAVIRLLKENGNFVSFHLFSGSKAN